MNLSAKSRILIMVCAAVASGVPGMLTRGHVSSAQAQPAAADKLKAAQDAFDAAQVSYLAGKFDEAAQGFQDAYAAKQFPQFLYNVGASFHMKGKKSSDVAAYEKAVEFYKKYLSEDPTAADKARVEKAIGVIGAEIKRIKDAGVPVANGSGSGSGSATPPPAPSAEIQSLGDVKVRGLVVIESEPANATIYLDDKKKGPLNVTPWSGSLEGEHKLIIEKRGYKIVETRLSADPSKLLVIKAVMAEDDYLGWVEIKSNVPGADIFLDDKSVGAIGKTPFSGNFKPGKHTLWIATDGYDEFKQEIDVIAGETAEIKAQLTGAPVGKLDVRGYGIEDASIYVDGKVLCERGPCLKSVKEGPHEISIRRGGYKTYNRRITIAARTETSLKVALSKEPSRSDAVVAYVLAGAFVGGGAYFGLQANKIAKDLKADIAAGTPPVDSGDPRLGWGFSLNNGKFNSVVADSLFAIGGITALTAIYYTFRDKGSPSTALVDVRALALTPVVGPSYAGLNMEVHW
jgi:hypothetical protein